VLLLLVVSVGLPVQAQTKLPVLVYHHLENPARSDVSCTPQEFRRHLEALLQEGFQPLGLQEIRAFLLGRKSLVVRPVAITFDDGYESLYHHALPVARSLRVPMIVFVVTARLGRCPQFTPYLTEEQVGEMAGSGWFDFGSHSHDLHTDVLRISEAFPVAANPVPELIGADARAAAAILQRVTGSAPIALAWPYGKFSPAMRQEARAAGFSLHFTSRFGYNYQGDDPLCIKRIPISSRDSAASVLRKVRGVMR